MPYSVQGGVSSISDFNELKTGGLWSITSETNRPDSLYKYWEVNVTVGKDGTVLQQAKVKAGGNSGIYSRMYRPSENDWTSWTQQFGYNSLDDLSSGVINSINKNVNEKSRLTSSFQSDKTSGSCNDVMTGGIYYVSSAVTDKPSGISEAGILITIGSIDNYRFQIFSQASGNTYYIRKYIYGAWAAWVKMA